MNLYPINLFSQILGVASFDSKMSKPPSKSVFVGNIPYGKYYFPSMDTETHSFVGLTEEQIKDIFGSAGKVMSFRLVYDRETGRPKGFGFVEFPDSGSLSTYHFCAQRRNSTSLLTFARLYRFCCIRCTKSERVRNHGPNATRRFL